MTEKSLLLAVLLVLTGCQAIHDAIEYNDSESLDYSTKQKFEPANTETGGAAGIASFIFNSL